jgi:hypothetical protein
MLLADNQARQPLGDISSYSVLYAEFTFATQEALAKVLEHQIEYNSLHYCAEKRCKASLWK